MQFAEFVGRGAFPRNEFADGSSLFFIVRSFPSRLDFEDRYFFYILSKKMAGKEVPDSSVWDTVPTSINCDECDVATGLAEGVIHPYCLIVGRGGILCAMNK